MIPVGEPGQDPLLEITHDALEGLAPPGWRRRKRGTDVAGTHTGQDGVFLR